MPVCSQYPRGYQGFMGAEAGLDRPTHWHDLLKEFTAFLQ